MENSVTGNECSMKKMEPIKRATWKNCNIKRMQHEESSYEKSSTRNKWYMNAA